RPARGAPVRGRAAPPPRGVRERGWRTVAGYQTRNPPHRAHEFLHKLALGLVDGLLIHPVVGRKKPGDFRDEVILDAYQAALANYYPKDRVLFSLLPYEMQYAGPKEAIHHAILRRNFGCTHFIVGRDHAGVGNFYHPEEAIRKFEDFPDLGIQPLTIRGDHFWCNACGQLESERTCSHGRAARLEFSGTLVRDLVVKGTEPPVEILRPEVFAAIRKHPDPFHR
ncbi:MAG TPA: sulfate adenylyltransferase, partial [Candidatus Thermoplasmatota archaeon]|nr:sulfate adenylyltransferase [Candidatus Thermoplasmatota archaeon]